MIKREYFKYEESAYNPNKYIIKPVFENLPLESTEGSFGVLAARVMGLSYAQYLRMCRDICGAEIIGKKSYYPVAFFKKDKLLFMLVKVLNARMNSILFDETTGKEIREMMQNI